MAATLCSLVVVATVGAQIPASHAVETAAEHIAGFQSQRSVAVEQAVDLIQRGDYSLALLRMSSERRDTSVPHQARVLGAYALLVAGNTLGAFPAESRQL